MVTWLQNSAVILKYPADCEPEEIRSQIEHLEQLSSEMDQKAEKLKEMSRSCQQLSKECTEDVGRSLISKLKQVKEMFHQVQQSVRAR